MSSIKKYILAQVAKQALSQDEAKRLLIELAGSGPERIEEVAIVGMAGRFPMADNAEQFWQLLRNGVNCIRPLPEQRRKDFEHVLQNPSYAEFLIGAPVPPHEVPHAHARAGYLEEIDKFDAAFFGIPPLEATYMDPHQRLALELAWETMEDAGYGGRRLYGSNTGIYIGKEGTNHSLYRYTSVGNPMKLTGSWESILASRISYLFNFRGPCMLIDTACSSGLVSIHMAAQAIMNGECDQAIAGGMNASTTGEFNTRYQGSMAMDAVESKDGVIRTFDARANGTVWGEGIGMVMLKPLARALADRDHIHAVIKGSAINNDGASNGLTAPNAESQEQVIVKAWQKARIDPASLSYIEAHGTGTVLGDPIEFKGLTEAFRRFTARRQFCAIGSLKTNMGHLVGASGVASLFKVVKSLQHREMAPTINFGKPNPYINFVSSPLYVNDAVRPWAAGATPRRAALSSFGFSHTNCHMVIEQAPELPVLARRRGAYCFTLSAHTGAVLRAYVERLRGVVDGDGWNLADLCYTLNTGRGHYAHRLAIVATSEQQLREQLAGAGAALEGVLYRHHDIVSEKKKLPEAHEITARQKKALSDRASAVLAEAVAAPGDDGVLHELVRHYTAGADLDWEQLYAGEPRRRLSVPGYPLQRIRVWAEPKISKVSAAPAGLHPLLERWVSRAGGEDVFESRFGAATHWVLADHKIKGTCVVPGTTYLEMARVAAQQSQGWSALELCDVFFLVPMVVEPQGFRRVRLRLVKEGDELAFDIESCAEGGAPEWLRHVEGRIRRCDAAAGAPLDLAGLKARAHETIEHYEGKSDTGVFQFGPHWDATRAAWRIGDDALARLALPAALQGELAVYQLHPSVLDNAVNLTSQSSGTTYLPFMYKSFKVFAPFTPQMYTLVQPKPNGGSDETVRYDVVLTDGDGKVLCEIGDYVAKKVSSFAFGSTGNGADGEYLATRWIARAAPALPAAPPARLLLISTCAFPARHDALAGALEQAGVAVSRLDLHEHVHGADGALGRLVAGGACDGVDGVIVADGGHARGAGLADAAALSRRRVSGVDALLHLVQGMLAAKTRLPWGLCVLTEQAYAVDGAEPAIDPFGAALAALGAVVGAEYQHLPCRLVDAHAGAEPAQLARYLLAAPAGRHGALRAGGTFARELYPLQLAGQAPAPLREDGVYLITGGAGGLGLALAAHLAARGRIKLVLMGRSALAPRDQWAALAAGADPRYGALCALQGQIAALDYIQADVADAAALDAALARVRAEHGPLRGVFHLAGMAGDGFLLHKPFATFDAVLAPKLDGSRNLYAATAADQLDCMVLFSSIVALTGGAGQGDYAAANAFMDALAAQGALDGRKLVSINWPAWQEVGMAAAHQVDHLRSPFAPLTTAEGFARLDRILAHGPHQVLPSTINPAALGALADALPFTLAPELQRRLKQDSRAAGAPALGHVEVAIGGKSEDEVTPTEIVLAQVYGAVLGLAEVDAFTSFQDMGGNSIIATHLLKLIDSQFPGLVDISDVFSYASIDDMGAYIDSKRPKAAPVDAMEAMLDQVMDGDASIDSLLASL